MGCVQLGTNKRNKFIISGTRFFGKNLMTDLKPDRQKELKNVHVIPTLFGRAKFLNKFFGLYYIYIWLNVGT